MKTLNESSYKMVLENIFPWKRCPLVGKYALIGKTLENSNEKSCAPTTTSTASDHQLVGKALGI